MVIRSDFDRSLWFMLVCDKKNRYDIVEFIKNIPKDIIESIYMELDKCPIGDDKYPLKRITKAFRNDVNDTYFYDISFNGCQIIINLSIWEYNDDRNHEVSQITLYSLSMDDIKNVNFEYPIYIGDYYHTISRMSCFFNTVVCNGNDRGYELIDFYDNLVSIHSVDGEINKGIDIGNIPNDFNFSDLDNKKCINRLVRKRR